MHSVTAFFAMFVIGASLPTNLGTYYDVTTLVKLVELSPGVIGHNGSLLVVTRGDARGLPLRKGNTLIVAPYAGYPCCQFWTIDGWSKLDSMTALAQKPPLNPYMMPIGSENSIPAYKNADMCVGSSHCIAPASVWMLGPTIGYLRSPSMPSLATKASVCITIVARISPGSQISIAMQHSGGPARFQIGKLSIGQEEKSRWLIKRLAKDIPKPLRNKPLEVVLTATQPKGSPDPVMIQWVASCNPEGDEDVYTVIETAQPLTSGFNVMVRSLDLQPSPVCMNGGLLDVDRSKCSCAPGFSGDRCDHGCGPDSFGKNCTGKCSSVFPGQQCGALLLCGVGGTCNCAPGFRGPKCMEMCEPGYYGIGCRESCGNCRDGVACDPYTGRCDGGCVGTIQPPYCFVKVLR